MKTLNRTSAMNCSYPVQVQTEKGAQVLIRCEQCESCMERRRTVSGLKPGQTVKRWWQKYTAGRLTTPLSIRQEALRELPDPSLAERLFCLPEDVRWEAPERLKAPNFFQSEAYMRQWDRADWQHVDMRLMRWAAMTQEYARKRGIPLYVHSAFRTRNEQNQLVARGVSRTPYPNSAHNIGEAVDIVHGTYHWEMTRQEWDMIGILGQRALDRLNATLAKSRQLNLTWGGTWSKPWDPAHWEISDYRQRTRELTVNTAVRYTPRRILRML